MPDRSPLDRLRAVGPQPVVRGVFFVFFVWTCVRLWQFAQWAIGNGPYVKRPEAVAGLIPVGAYMSFFAWLRSGYFDVVVPAGIVIIIGALITSILFKRGFCGWICPVGTLWRFFEWLGFKRGLSIRVPKWLDTLGHGVKYLLGAAAIFILLSMSVQEALSFQQLPYYATADIAILRLMLTWQWWIIAGVAAVASVFFGSVWCQYLCPLGAYYGIAGMASACVVKRDPNVCIDCGTCAKVCHARIEVDEGISVRSAECDGCMTCVRSCPAPGALDGRLLGVAVVKPWAWAGLVVAVWLVVYGVAVTTGHWSSGVPQDAWPMYVRSVLLR